LKKSRICIRITHRVLLEGILSRSMGIQNAQKNKKGEKHAKSSQIIHDDPRPITQIKRKKTPMAEQNKAKQLMIVSEYFESIINTVREPLIVLDHEFKVVSASRSFYDVFKVKPEETMGQLIYDLGNRQWDIPKLRELLEDILPKKTTFDDYEVEHDFISIGRRTMLLNARRIPSPPEKPKAILLAIEDITKRKSMEESYLRLAAIVNTSIDGIIGETLHGDVVSWNQGAEKIYGYTEKEMQGQNISILAPPGYKKEILNQLKKLRTGELIENFETKRVRKDGVEIDISLTLSPIKDKLGNICGISAIMHDITEQKKAKQVMIVSEYSESIINTVREPLIVLDQDLEVVSASRSFYEVFKVEPEDTVGQLIYNLGNHQWDIPKLRELLEDILPKKAAFDNYEVEHDFSTIGRRIMLLNARQIERGTGKEKIILLAIEDITERKEIEAGLEKTRKELAVIKKSADEALEYADSTINTIREPLIVLDQDLKVISASRAFYGVFKVKPKDTVGQLIYNLGNHQWDIPKLRELLEDILPKKAAFDNYEVEHDFYTIGRRIMLLNARQIQRGLGKEHIILLAIEDITERKEIEAGLEKTRKELAIIKKSADEVSEFAESVINTVREPLISLDQDLRVVTVSRSFYEFFKVKPEDTVGQLIYDLGNKQWNIPKLRELLETILPQKATFDNYEVEHDFATIGRRTMLLNARQIERGMGKEKIILLAIEDITERKEIEAGLEKTRKDLAVIKKSADEVSEFAESVINTVREPLISLDQDLRVVTVSRSFYEFFKVKPEDTVGQLIYDLGNKQWNIPKLRELLETILPQKATFDNYEVEHDFSTIGRRVMLLNARQIERGKGKERIILLAIEDITERKEIEAGLEKTRKELAVIKKSADEVSEFAESVINTVREPLISLDQDLRVVTVSRSFYEFFKVKPEDTVGQLIYDLGNKQWNIPKLRELLEDILPKKAAFDNYEVEHDFSTIGRRVMLLNARQIERGKGKERIILLAIEDITERKEIEAGLEKTRKELAIIKKSADEALEYADSTINTIREPLIVLDQDLKVISASRSFYEVFKVDSLETVGQLIYDLGNRQWDIPKLRELLEDILPKKAAFDDYEVEHEFASIGQRVMLLNARQIVRGKGKERIILLAIEDITERKAVELALKASREVLAHRSAELEAVNKELEAFAYSVSHDLRAPLRSLDGFSMAMLEDYDDKLDATGKDYLQRIRKASQRMSQLIDDMLKLSRITRMGMKYETVNLSQVAMSVMNELQSTQPDRLVDIKIAEGLTVNGDPNLLRILLENLLGNAWKYTSRHSSARIEFGSTAENGQIIYFIRDDGAGFDMAYVNKLFSPFNRLHTADEFPGTGIGLATSQRIIVRHGGTIRAEGAVDKGATIFFTLNDNKGVGG
jgi:two-component system cell cycle sensor histidine kinase PleC